MKALSYQWPGGTNKIHKSIRIASVPTRIQTSYLQPKILKSVTTMPACSVMWENAWVKDILRLNFPKSTPSRYVVWEDLWIHSFLTPTPDGSVLTSCPCWFTHEREPWHPLNRRLGRHQSWYGHFWEENNLLSTPRPSNP
jgi:hypothetical protein